MFSVMSVEKNYSELQKTVNIRKYTSGVKLARKK